MTAPDPHASFEELAVGHALGALEPDDEQRFLAHLPSCARCERAVLEQLETAAHLAYAADPATPPAGLWLGIRAAVEASDPEAFTPSLVQPVLPAPVASLDEQRVRRGGAGRRTVLKRAAALTSVAAGIAMVVALVAQNVALREREQEQLAWSKGVERVLSAYGSDVRVLPLKAQGSDQAAAVAVVEGDRLHLVVDTLEANDARSSTYVLWERSMAGDVRAVGTFDVAGDHDVEVVEDLKVSEPGLLKALMVTHEKGRTAPAVSTQPALATFSLA